MTSIILGDFVAAVMSCNLIFQLQSYKYCNLFKDFEEHFDYRLIVSQHMKVYLKCIFIEGIGLKSRWNNSRRSKNNICPSLATAISVCVFSLKRTLENPSLSSLFFVSIAILSTWSKSRQCFLLLFSLPTSLLVDELSK